MMHASRTLALICGCAAAPALAGPLTPPPGAISPTYKTMHYVEPRQEITFEETPGDSSSVHLLNQPGSYYLTSNLYVPGGKIGLKVDASNVTIDLNGFSIIDLGGAAGPATAGVQSMPGHTHVVVRNGSVSGGHRGVFIVSADSSRVEGVHCSGQAAEAFFIGASSLVIDCTASGAAVGFFVGDGSRAERCIASGNSDDGFYVSHSASADGCTARNNADQQFTSGQGSSFRSCNAYGGAGGFLLGQRSSARDCDAESASQAGFTASDRATIDRCTSTQSPVGYWLGAHVRLTNSSATATGEAGVGIQVVGDEVIVRGNTVLDAAAGVFLVGTTDQCTVVGNYFSSTVQAVLNSGSQNNIGEISFDASTANPHANFID